MFWRSLAHLLAEIWEAGELELERLAYQQDLAILQAAIMLERDTKQIAKAVDRSLDAVRHRLQPWYRKQREEAVQGLAREMDAQWAEAWGDPTDPATKAKIEEARQALLPRKARAPAAQPKKPQQKIASKWQPKRARSR